MQFNSYIFLFLFFPLIVLLYFAGNKFSFKVGKLILAIGSLCFYAYAGYDSLAIFCFSILINYVFALAIKRNDRFKKLFLFIPVVINVALLLVFKYTDFAISNLNSLFDTDFTLKELLLPLGISFYTFQQIAYIVAVYKREIPEPDFLDYLVFITYFPKLLMGPLTEPADFISQLNNNALKNFDFDNFTCGLKIFC